MKHSHYFKDVSALSHIDVYRVLTLFSVTDPCVQHAIKKLLVSGERGAKDAGQDIREAIDSLTRYLAMREEEAVRTVPGSNGWIPWLGSGKCPTGPDDVIEFRLRWFDEGIYSSGRAGQFAWGRKDEEDQIIAYRVVG